MWSVLFDRASCRWITPPWLIKSDSLDWIQLQYFNTDVRLNAMDGKPQKEINKRLKWPGLHSTSSRKRKQETSLKMSSCDLENFCGQN